MDPNPDYDASDEIEYFLNFVPWGLRGVYPPPAQFEAWFVSLAHNEASVDRTLEAAAEALDEALA